MFCYNNVMATASVISMEISLAAGKYLWLTQSSEFLFLLFHFFFLFFFLIVFLRNTQRATRKLAVPLTSYFPPYLTCKNWIPARFSLSIMLAGCSWTSVAWGLRHRHAEICNEQPLLMDGLDVFRLPEGLSPSCFTCFSGDDRLEWPRAACTLCCWKGN